MSVIQDFKEIGELLKKGATVPAQEKIMELREKVLKLQEENIGLKKRINEVEEQLKISKKMIFKKLFYYVENDDVPFCPNCWEDQKKAIHLHNIAVGVYQCFNCKSNYVTNGDKTPGIYVG